MSKQISHNNEFTNIVADILKNQKFQELDNELHHGITRYAHSLRVAKATYRYAKKLNLDYIAATKAALMHDFFLTSDLDKSKNNRALSSSHPVKAVENAKTYFEIDEIQENIIASHMFPLGNCTPKSKEAWLVTSIDKGVAIWEMYRYKFSLVANIWAIFIFNMITLQK